MINSVGARDRVNLTVQLRIEFVEGVGCGGLKRNAQMNTV